MRGTSNHPTTSAASVAERTSTVYTQHGAYRTTHAEWTRVEKMRTGLLNQTRRARQLEQAWKGTVRLYGETSAAAVVKREQYVTARAKIEAKTQALRAALERIERECEPASGTAA